MKFRFSSGITLACGKCEPALKLRLSFNHANLRLSAPIHFPNRE